MFEEGTRVFYIFPQPLLDSRLPLSIGPKPAKTARVFVGRIEVITPEAEQAVLEAVTHNDRAALARYGRFLEPIAMSLARKRPNVWDALQPASELMYYRETADCPAR
jgi:hypothetical protein